METQTKAVWASLALLVVPGTSFAQPSHDDGVIAEHVPHLAELPDAADELTEKPHSGVYDVRQFGAKADGRTDDTAAWQAALDAAGHAGGGEVVVPSGKSVIEEVEMPSGVHLHGQGPGASIILPKTDTSGGINFPANGTQDDVVDNLGYLGKARPDGNTSVQRGGQFVHIGRGTRFIHIYDFKVFYAYRAFQIDGGSESYIDHGEIYRTAAAGDAIRIEGGNDQYVSHVVANNEAGSEASHGVYVTNNGGFWLSDADFIHFRSGLYLEGSLSPLEWSFISNTAFDTNTACGITIYSPTGGAIRGMNFSQVWSASSQKGLCIDGNGSIDGITLNGFRAMNNRQEGIVIQQGKNIEMNAAMIACNGGYPASSIGQYDAVVVQRADGWSIRDSRIGDASGCATTARHAISVGTAANSDFQVVGNDLRGSFASAIAVAPHARKAILSNNLE